uniref:Guanylate cyclase n=1 Tax=Gasterosteus aculeatus aculeatus TaxID=481459 RepID=A0AAQ4R8Y0_GASAC
MASHRDPRFLHNLSYHPRWQHDSMKVKRKGRLRTASANSCRGHSAFKSLAASSLKPQLPSCPVQRSRSRCGNWLLLPLLVFSFLPCQAWATTFKVALVGPWTCDLLYSKALPDLAARLATARINKDPHLNKGYWYDYTLVNEDCKSSRALARFAGLEGYGAAFLGPANPGYCSSAALYAKEWDVGILSWACLKPNMNSLGMYSNFLRPLPLSSRVLFSVLRYFRWAHVAIISEETDIWEATGQELASSLRALGLPVNPVVTMESDKEGPRRALAKVRETDRVRVVIMCMPSVLIGGQAQYQLLTTAFLMRMIDRGYVFIPYDTLLYSLPYKDAPYYVLGNDTKLRKAFDGVLTITVDSGERNFYEAFKDAQDSFEIRSTTPPEQVSPFFGTIYNMIYYTAMAAEQARADGGRWVTGPVLGESKGGFEFEGFNQPLKAGREGEGMQARYVVLDYSGFGHHLYSTHVLDATHTYGGVGSLKYLGRSIHFAGSTPYTDSGCWFSPYFACTGGEGRSILIAGNGHSKLMTDTSGQLLFTFFFPVFGFTKSVLLCLSKGDWVWLKKCAGGTVSAVNSSTEFVFLRDMRHENLNLFLGLFCDSGILAVVTEHCTRGSLENLLNNEEVRLDWMFKSSLLIDLIRGMKYLHNRGIIHGRLKSRNCVVDGRFVLKVTDYGFNEILIAQGIDSDDERPENLLWTAPELLRSASLRRRGSFAGDVYSFSIIGQEVISRSSPYCMLDMPPKEIISKLKEPPPLCRPVLSVEQSPVEVVQVMKHSWSEEPEKRPTFEEIFKLFKNITKGKKTNIIDSMLRMLEQYSSNLEDLIRERTEELEVERQKTDKLVAQMLPKSVAQALKTGKPVKPEHFSEVTLYFSDIVGFTTISALSDPIEVVDLLNDLYTLFDAIIGLHDVYKVETIGDAYMVASGVPTRNGNRHAAEMANMSLDILHCIGTFKMRHMPDLKVRIRIGLHSGPVVAGVVGLTMPRYCLFGDTVNTASRMESTGLPYRIHVNKRTVDVLNSLDLGYKIQTRGLTELKGKGIEYTYWLVGREDFDKPLPIPPDLEIPLDRRQKFLDRQKKMS